MIRLARDWHPGPERPRLDDNEVHVWAIPLDGPWPRHDLIDLLAEDERHRAERFHFERDRRRFVVARATLRRILASCVGTEGAALRFVYGPRGKPALAPGQPAEVRFNLSHSDGLALCAVARRREVGVDVEHVERAVDVERLADRFFSTDERAEFQGLAHALRREAFFRVWTRKEAYLKAIGLGLYRCSTTFDVTVQPGRAPELRRVHDDPTQAARWSLCDLDPAAGFVGALLAEQRGWSLRRWSFPG